MSKKADSMMDDTEDSDELPLPEAPPGRLSSTDVETDTPAPRTARFGEGPEGKPARRERGVTGSQAGYWTRTVQFWRDVRAEMRRVTWPSMGEVQNTTIIVIIAVIFFAVYLFLVDRGISFLVTELDVLLNKLLNFFGIG